MLVPSRSRQGLIRRIQTGLRFLLLFPISSSLALAGSSEVNVYSGRKEALIAPVLEAFTEKTGIRVNLLTGKADQLRARLLSEGRNTPADILLTSDVANLYRASAGKLFQAINSDLLVQRIPSRYRDPNGEWFGLSIRARVIAYAKERVIPNDLSTYEDLADPRWRGKIIVRSSSNVYNQSLIASMLVAHGNVGAGKWVKSLVENMARRPQGGDTDQIRALASGEADVAIVNSYYFGRLLASGNERDRKVVASVGIFFPNQDDRGTHVNISGAGVTAHAKHRSEAIEFLEFLSGPQGQRLFADINHEFPVNGEIAPSPIVAGWGSFKADALELATLGVYNGDAIRLADEFGWR
jgi:iron(III) transport system substrate-binding protein